MFGGHPIPDRTNEEMFNNREHSNLPDLPTLFKLLWNHHVTEKEIWVALFSSSTWRPFSSLSPFFLPKSLLPEQCPDRGSDWPKATCQMSLRHRIHQHPAHTSTAQPGWKGQWGNGRKGEIGGKRSVCMGWWPQNFPSTLKAQPVLGALTLLIWIPSLSP